MANCLLSFNFSGERYICTGHNQLVFMWTGHDSKQPSEEYLLCANY